jgi:hypothetical protein
VSFSSRRAACSLHASCAPKTAPLDQIFQFVPCSVSSQLLQSVKCHSLPFARLLRACGALPVDMSDKLAPSERYTVTLQDRPIYQWNQTLTSVDIYVPIPPGVKAKQLFVDIANNNIKFGITPNPPYMDVSPYQALIGCLSAYQCSIRCWCFVEGIHLACRLLYSHMW